MTSAAPARPFEKVIVVANARIPGERAQSIQTVRTAAAFARAGCQVDLFYARRRFTREVVGARPGDPLAYYGVREAIALHAIAVLDCIDAVPVRFQTLPARLEEWSFGRNAASAVLTQGEALVHCREIEVAARLAAAGFASYLFEAHSLPRNPLKRRWMRRALAGALGIVSITRGLAEDLTAVFGVSPQSILVVPDAFEAAAFASLPERRAAREALSIPIDRFVVVYAGHLFAWKGIDTLLEAASLRRGATFVLVGGLPQDVERVRRQVEERRLAHVDVRGHRPPAEVPAYLAAADAVAVPNTGREAISARHTSPLKLFEAMAAGCAIVASDLPSLREVLTHGENALLVPPDDPAALAAALADLEENAALRLELARRARAAAAGHSFDARARAILDFAVARRSAKIP